MTKLRLLNPFVRISSEAEGRTAARAGAVGVFLTVAWSAISLFGLGNLKVMRSAMVAGMNAAPHPDPEAARMAEAMMPMMVNFVTATSIAFMIGYVVLGLVQWKKQTRVIPLLLLLWTAYSLLMGLLSWLINPALMASTAAAVEIPVWQRLLSHAVTLVTLLLFIAGFRGGSYLYRLHKPTPTQPAGA